MCIHFKLKIHVGILVIIKVFIFTSTNGSIQLYLSLIRIFTEINLTDVGISRRKVTCQTPVKRLRGRFSVHMQILKPKNEVHPNRFYRP